MRRFVTAFAVSALFLAACGGRGGVTLPSDPDAVVLQVRSVGGFAPIVFLINRPPRYTLTAGGDLIFEDPTPQSYPAPLLVGLRVTHLDASTMSRILEVVDAMGLPGIDRETNQEASSRVADATTEIVVYTDATGREHRFSVYALGLVKSSDPRVSRFADLVDLLAEAASGDSRPYESAFLQVWVAPAEGPADEPSPDVREWPLPQPYEELSPVMTGWRCAVYEGAERTRLLEAFSDATHATRWRSGIEYTILARFLVPGEQPCAPPGSG